MCSHGDYLLACTFFFSVLFRNSTSYSKSSWCQGKDFSRDQDLSLHSFRSSFSSPQILGATPWFLKKIQPSPVSPFNSLPAPTKDAWYYSTTCSTCSKFITISKSSVVRSNNQQNVRVASYLHPPHRDGDEDHSHCRCPRSVSPSCCLLFRRSFGPEFGWGLYGAVLLVWWPKRRRRERLWRIDLPLRIRSQRGRANLLIELCPQLWRETVRWRWLWW
jgi:hypothetical protein